MINISKARNQHQKNAKQKESMTTERADQPIVIQELLSTATEKAETSRASDSCNVVFAPQSNYFEEERFSSSSPNQETENMPIQQEIIRRRNFFIRLGKLTLGSGVTIGLGSFFGFIISLISGNTPLVFISMGGFIICPIVGVSGLLCFKKGLFYDLNKTIIYSVINKSMPSQAPGIEDTTYSDANSEFTTILNEGFTTITIDRATTQKASSKTLGSRIDQRDLALPKKIQKQQNSRETTHKKLSSIKEEFAEEFAEELEKIDDPPTNLGDTSAQQADEQQVLARS